MSKFIYDGDVFKLNIDGKAMKLTISQDEGYELNPRTEMDNVSTMLCWHREYTLGDDNPYTTFTDCLRILATKKGVSDKVTNILSSDLSIKNKHIEMMTLLNEDYDMLIKYLYLYDHSGITISTTDFNDKWDSGVVGLVYITKDQAIKELGATEDNWRELADKCIEAEVETYDQYIRGDVYRFELCELKECPTCHNIEEEFVDSCGGFYGNDILENGMLDYLPEEFVGLFKEEN